MKLTLLQLPGPEPVAGPDQVLAAVARMQVIAVRLLQPRPDHKAIAEDLARVLCEDQLVAAVRAHLRPAEVPA